MKLKKRKKKTGIDWETCLEFGVKNTRENKQRFNKGEALDLMADSLVDIEVKHDPISNILSDEFIKEQEQSEKKFLDAYYEKEAENG